MIKFNTKTEAGRNLIGLGITEKNILQMKLGHPIHVHCDELGYRGEFVIFFGASDEQLAADIKAHFVVGEYLDRRKDKKN